MPEITFTIPVKPVAGKGARAERYRQDSKQYIPEWFPHLSNHHRRYSMTVLFHYVGECNGDMDNRLACIFDAVKGKVIFDDFQVKELYCSMIEFSDKTATVVTLREIERKKPPIKATNHV